MQKGIIGRNFVIQWEERQKLMWYGECMGIKSEYGYPILVNGDTTERNIIAK